MAIKKLEEKSSSLIQPNLIYGVDTIEVESQL